MIAKQKQWITAAIAALTTLTSLVTLPQPWNAVAAATVTFLGTLITFSE